MVTLAPESLTHERASHVAALRRKRTLIDRLLDGKTIKRAAIEADVPVDSAYKLVAKRGGLVPLVESFSQILDRVGVTDEYLARKVHNLTNAQETKFFQKDGQVIETAQVDALETQRKTVELATKLKGHLKDRTEVDIRMGVMAMVVDAMKVRSE
jgi:hypothetical protein